MTTEQDNQRVSDAYRDIATQTTPADLDEKVLQLAASAVPSRYGLARAWVRPLAWAATIALSLAFVLEMSQLNDTPAPPVRDDVPAEEALTESLPRNDADLMKVKEEKDIQHGITAKRSPAAAPVPAVIDADEMEPLLEAEESVRLQSDDATASRARTSVSDFAAPVEEAYCNAETRASADDWYACITALREEGLNDAADSEFEALREVFPGFAEGRE